MPREVDEHYGLLPGQRVEIQSSWKTLDELAARARENPQPDAPNPGTRREFDDRYWNSTEKVTDIVRAMRINPRHAQPSPIFVQCPKCGESKKLTSRQAREKLGTSCPSCRRRWVPCDPPAGQVPQPAWKDWYNRYLKSPEWRERADRILERDGYRCRVCNSPHRLQVHHRTYERLGHEEDGDLVVLCAECHDVFHTNKRLANTR